MSFKKLRGVKLPYRVQGQIYFTCINYAQQPEEIKKKIRRLCEECGGEYADALFCRMTRENVSSSWVAQQYHISEALLYEKRRKFYERWYQEMRGLRQTAEGEKETVLLEAVQRQSE